MAMIAPMLPVIGALAGAGGAIMGGMAQSDAANYQAQVAANNAITAQQNATMAQQAGTVQAQAAGMKGAARSGAIKAALAANGVDVNSGSAVDVQASQREMNQLDATTVMNNANLQAYGYRTNAVNDQAQSGLYKQEADYAPIGAAFGALGSLAGNSSSGGIGSLLSGASSFGSKIGGLGSLGGVGG